MESNAYRDIRDLLGQLYLEDERPWLVGFSGGKDSTMVASLIFDTVLSILLGSAKNLYRFSARTRELKSRPSAKWSKAR